MAGSLLRRHDVRLIVGAVGISSVGDFLLWVPLTKYLQRTTGSAIAIAGLFLALWLAALVGLALYRTRLAAEAAAPTASAPSLRSD